MAAQTRKQNKTNYLNTPYMMNKDVMQFTESIREETIPSKRRTLMLYMPQEVEPKIIIDAKKIIFGRGIGENKMDLSLQYANMLGVSRNHAELSFSNGYYFVTDLGSSNGTYINEYKLVPNKPYIIQSGDQIRMGHFIIVASFK